MAKIRSFEELDAWKMATEIRRELRVVVKSFPEHERFMLSSQVTRAARSVTNNVAEGFGRYTFKDNVTRCTLILNGLIRYLRNTKPGEMDVEEPYIPYHQEYPTVYE